MKTYDVEKLSLVTPAKLSAYLKVQGWSMKELKENRWSAWSEPQRQDDEAIEVLVPLDISFRDYARRVAELVENLSIAEARASDGILRDIMSGDRDRVRLRIAGPHIRAGRVSLAAGTVFTATAQTFMATAARASDAATRKEVYSGRSSQRVNDFLKKVELLPPESGSFVLNLETPIPPQVQLHPSDAEHADELPFERKVGISLAESFAAAAESLRDFQLNGNSQAFADGIKKGVSANLCEALARVLEETPAELFHVSFSWSSNRPVPNKIASKVSFARDAAPVFKEAARHIRSHAPEQDFQIAGFPMTLKAHDENSASGGGRIAVMAMVDDKPKRVQIDLNPRDYRLAIKAHSSSKAIRLEGELVRTGRKYVLTNHRHMELLDDEE